LQALRAACHAIAKVATIARDSRVYSTAPVGPPQPDYLNAAILVDYDRPHIDLFDELLRIEIDLGRIRRERWGPRIIDLDILLIDQVALSDVRLVVPHPHLEERAFALLPLLDVWPDAVHPTTKRRYADVPVEKTGLTATDLSLVWR
jgi:2-amino-4-hydroxy-6-hydroxymethyldihydropteridine diphosphokinase